MADNSADEIVRILREAFDRFRLGDASRSIGETIDNLDDFSKSLGAAERSASQLGDSHRELGSDISSNIKWYRKNDAELGRLASRLSSAGSRVESLGEDVKSAERAYQNLSASATQDQRDAARQRLERLRRAHEEAEEEHKDLEKRLSGNKKLDDSVKGLGTTFGKLVDGVVGITRDLLQGSNAISFSTGVLTKGIDVTAAGLKTVGTAFDGLGDILSLGGPIGKTLGLAFKGAGKLAEMFAESAELVKEGVEILGQEIQKTANSYQTLASAGVTFAGGMEEMRELSQSAAMGLEPFTRIVKENSAQFAAAGLGMTGAAKRFASISKSMSESGLREQISNLGYSFEEFGGLTADVMAQLNASGQLRFKSDQEIGQLTVDYAKNLRLISDITGQDAKKKMEQARKESLKAGIYEKLMAIGGPEAIKKFEAQIAGMPESMHQAYMEFIATGGNAVVSAASNLAAQAIPGMMDALRSGFGSLQDTGEDVETANRRNLEQMLRLKEQSMQATGLGSALGTVQILGGSGNAAEGANMISSMRAQLQSFGGSVAEANARIKQAGTAPGKLTEDLSKLTEDYQRAKGVMEGIAGNALPGFSGILVTATGAVERFANKINETMDWLEGRKKVEQELSRPADVGSAWSAVGTPGRKKNAASFGAFDAVGGDWDSAPGKALGGVSVGPKSGYLEKLHGVEAVVPLPDGRSIPVAMESGGFDDLAKLMKEHIKLAQDMVDTLRGSQDIQDRLLANSY